MIEVIFLPKYSNDFSLSSDVAMKISALYFITVVVLFVLGISGIIGSWGFISDPSGRSIGVSSDLLAGSPFSDFLVPGIILLVCIGISGLFVAIQVIGRARYHALWVIVQGIVLFIWLTVQLGLNSDFYYPVLHIPCYVLAALLMLLGYRLSFEKAWNPFPGFDRPDQ